MEEQLDLTIMYDFNTDLYGKSRRSMTEREKLQVDIATIIYTSAEDALSALRETPDIALKHVMALDERKSLKKAIQAELNRRDKKRAQMYRAQADLKRFI